MASLIVVLIPGVVSALDTKSLVQGPTSGLVQHVTDGLSDPFGPTSTLPLHVAGVAQGLASTVVHPFGAGIGTVTLAAQKFGGATSGTELVLSDVGVALGFPGLLAYGAVVVLGIRTLYRVATLRRDFLAMVALAIPLVLFMRWLSGGQYATAILPWLMLGWADRQSQSKWQDKPSAIEAVRAEAPLVSGGARGRP